MIKNEYGQIAIAYFQPMPQTVKVRNIVYNFIIKHAVSMAWVNEEHVIGVLKITRTCCGGNVSYPYRYATQGQVNVWSGLGR
jgi:hypothetical protein